MTGRSTASGVAPSPTPKEYEDYLERFGQVSRTDLKKVKKGGGTGFVGVFVMSRVGEAKSFIGTTSSPHDIAKQLHRFSWEETQCDLVAWTADKLIATHLLKFVRAALAPAHHRDSWYGIQGGRAAQIVMAIAANARIEIFDDAQREKRLEQDVTRAIGKIKERMDGSPMVRRLPPARGAEVIHLGTRKKQ